MGTNFYLNTELYDTEDEWKPSCHIGKRSAAGFYCWDCGVTLCEAGPERVHYSETNGRPTGWHERCPACGAVKDRAGESFATSSAGRELGFNRSEPRRKSGVASCSSFSWAMPPSGLAELVAAVKRTMLIDAPIINEYGDSFTLEEFMAILEECPLQSTDSVGVHFS